jgi:hypothetical protein
MRSDDLARISRALDNARNGTTDPVRAPQYLRGVLDELGGLSSALYKGAQPTRMVVQSRLANVVWAPGVGIQPTGDIDIKFPRPGLVVGIAGTVLQGANLLSQVSFSLKVNGDQQLTTTGTGEGFVPLSIIGQGASGEGFRFFPLAIRVAVTDRWFVNFTSEVPLPGTGAAITYTPKVVFLVEEE